MTREEYADIQAMNEELARMKELGLIEGYSFEIGDSLATSSINLKVSEEMVPHGFKSQHATIH